jgi:cephalosporin hydroxylase
LAGKFGRGPVLVMLDSAHDAPHVRAEMEVYAPFVTHGSYLIVEDTNVNGHPAHPEHGPGPFEAVQDFLATHDEFTPDPFCEKYLLTMHPGGWLRRAS